MQRDTRESAGLAPRRKRKGRRKPRITRALDRDPIGRLEDVPVLVLDDDAAGAKLLAVVLRSEGCVVKVAGSAEEALAILATFRPRVVVADLVLPLMSGVLLAQRLKADPTTRDIVLIAVTAFNGTAAETTAREAGFVAYVRKPIDPLTFTEIVLQHLGGAS
jgi:CheY-like chemotaxis protein